MKTEIYIHIPFCVRKCLYCDFLSFPAAESFRRQYLEALLQEIRVGFEKVPGVSRTICGPAKEAGISSIFIGGGTPSVLPAEGIEAILDAVRNTYSLDEDAEITIEVNPGTADPGKLQRYRRAGINRISFGSQSFHDEELRLLGRIHTAEDIRQSVQLARKAGFANINLDLISGIPGQTLPDWEDTLRQAIGLSPAHISAYSLIIEEGTPFYRVYGENGAAPDSETREDTCRTVKVSEGVRTHLPLPDEETERLMYVRTGEILAEAGYQQYEISNYARKDCACRHNIGYWTGVPYIGYGLGAAGFLPGSSWIRYSHTRDMQTYLSGRDIYTEIQCLNDMDLAAEFMILGLRMTAGVEDAEFERRFGRSLDSVYGDILDKYEKQGFLIRENGRTRLSPAGVSVSNPILADFL